MIIKISPKVIVTSLLLLLFDLAYECKNCRETSKCLTSKIATKLCRTFILIKAKQSPVFFWFNLLLILS